MVGSASWFSDTWSANDQRHLGAFLPQRVLVQIVFFAHAPTVIAREDDDRVIRDPHVIDGVEEWSGDLIDNIKYLLFSYDTVQGGTHQIAFDNFVFVNAVPLPTPANR